MARASPVACTTPSPVCGRPPERKGKIPFLMICRRMMRSCVRPLVCRANLRAMMTSANRSPTTSESYDRHGARRVYSVPGQAGRLIRWFFLLRTSWQFASARGAEDLSVFDVGSGIRIVLRETLAVSPKSRHLLRQHPFDRRITAIPSTRPAARRSPRAGAVKGGASHRRVSVGLPLTGMSTVAPLRQVAAGFACGSISKLEDPDLIISPPPACPC